jgi:hypothetical protein
MERKVIKISPKKRQLVSESSSAFELESPDSDLPKNLDNFFARDTIIEFPKFVPSDDDKKKYS